MRKDRQKLRLKTFEEHITKSGGIKKAIKQLTDAKEWIPNLKDKKGKPKTKRQDLISIATTFYRDLYSMKTITEESDLADYTKVPEFMTHEIETAIETQKRDKAPGPDRISNELLIAGKTYVAPILTAIFNEVLNTEIIPKQWTCSTITLIHKKGDKNEINNYRPISLMSNIYKVFAKVILKRITKILDENQPKEQAGFRSDFSTIDHIYVVKQIFEKSKEYNIPFYCCFVDYSKAFDSLVHERIWIALKNQGVDSKYIRIIRNIYKNSTARVKLEREGEEITIKRGVRQGDPLSPKLFSAVLEEIFRHLSWDNFGLNINGEKLTHLRFADDLIIFASTKDEIQKMLNQLDTESRQVGLTMNHDKTKMMTNDTQEPVTINNSNIEYVNEYTYLGQIISPTDLMSKELEIRTANAWKRYWSFREIMKNKEINMYIKRKLYNTCIMPVLTYGCQTWALTKAHTKKLEVCQAAMERSMLGKRRLDKMRNETLRRRTKIENVALKVKKLKWRWTGHTVRGREKWSRTLMNWFPKYNKRKRGRPFKRWEDELKGIAGKTWTRTARDREGWKRLEEAFAENGQTDIICVDVM